MKTVTNGSLIERDRLLEYSVGSFYNEVNVFILMQKEQNQSAGSKAVNNL